MRHWPIGLGMLLGAWFVPAGQIALAETDDARWTELRGYLFEQRPIHDGVGVLRLIAPERAHDAATVPIEIIAEIPQTPERYITTVHLLIDNNPSPLAGVFHLTPASGRASIATRVRVDAYTNIRAVAETSDGELYMASRFVKASGGCAVPSASRDHAAALASLGEMRLKPMTTFEPGVPNQVKLMIRHPNYTGLQKDQLTHNWIPPHFVNEIRISYDDRTVMTVEGDISLSENPAIEFSFVPDGPGKLEVEARDTEDNRFNRSWPIGGRPGA